MFESRSLVIYGRGGEGTEERITKIQESFGDEVYVLDLDCIDAFTYMNKYPNSLSTLSL